MQLVSSGEVAEYNQQNTPRLTLPYNGHLICEKHKRCSLEGVYDLSDLGYCRNDS